MIRTKTCAIAVSSQEPLISDAWRAGSVMLLSVCIAILQAALSATPAVAEHPPDWSLYYETEFQIETNDWLPWVSQIGGAEIKDGQLILSSRANQVLISAPLPLGEPLLNFALEVETCRLDGDGEFGFLVRISDDNNYLVCSVTTSGWYRILEVRDGTPWLKFAWAQSGDYDILGVNTLSVLASESDLTLSINQRVVARVSNVSVLPGTAELYVSVRNSPGLAISWDSLKVFVDPETQQRISRAESTLLEGIQYYSRREWSRAISALQSARDLFDDLGWQDRLAQTLLYQGHTLVVLGELIYAESTYEDALRLARTLEDLEKAIEASFGLAAVYSSRGFYARALDVLVEARSLCPGLGANYLGRLEFRAGEILLEQQEYAEAREHYNIALQLAGELHFMGDQIDALLALAIVAAAVGDIDQARNHAELASTLSGLDCDSLTRARTMSTLGRCYMFDHDWARASGSLRTAVKLFTLEGYLLDAAGTQLLLGDCLFALFEFEQAYDLYQQAFETFQSHQSARGQGDCLLRIAKSLTWWGRSAEALDVLEEAQRILNDTGNATTEAECLMMIGTCYYGVGSYDRAKASYEQAEWNFRDLSNPEREANALDGTGVCLLALQEMDAAASYFRRAASLYYESGNAVGSALSESYLGICHFRQERYAEALEALEHSHEMLDRLDNGTATATVLLNIGNCYFALGAFAEAALSYVDAAEGYRLADSPQGELAARICLGDTYFADDLYAEAQAQYETAHILIEDGSLGDEAPSIYPDLMWRIYTGMGEVAIALGDFDTGLSLVKKAVDIVESIRCALPKVLMRDAFSLERGRPYEILIENLGNPAEALLYAERAKARSLVEMMETAIVRDWEELPEELGTVSQQARGLSTTRVLFGNENLGIENDSLLSDIQARLATVSTQQSYEESLAELERTHPELGQTLTLNPSQIEERLQDVVSQIGETELILEYFVTRSDVFLWAIRSDGVTRMYQLGVAQEQLWKIVAEYRELIENVPVGPQAAVSFIETLRVAGELYQLLISPVEEYLEGIDTIIVIPSGMLFYVPFASLYRCENYDGMDLLDGNFMIRNFSITQAPSLVSLHRLVQSHENQAYQSLFAVAADDLPFASEGVDRIALLFTDPTLLQGLEATESNVKNTLREHSFDILHFSTHGVFDQAAPLRSHLELGDGEGEDGLFSAGEVLGLDTSASLVVLSACQTALPSHMSKAGTGIVAGDEIRGFGQAFLTSGVSSLVLTLWDINSLLATKLMEIFYRELGTGCNVSEALRAAQDAISSKVEYQHPFYWAPFTLYGAWRAT